MRAPPPAGLEALEEAKAEADAVRREERRQDREEYEAALVEMRQTVLDEEGTDLRDRLFRDRSEWVAQVVGDGGQVPETLEPFYAQFQATDEEAKASEEAEAAAGGGSKKGKEEKGKGKGKGKGKKGDDDDAPEMPMPLVGRSGFSQLLEKLIRGYEATWLDKHESAAAGGGMSSDGSGGGGGPSRYDEDLAKEGIRPMVEQELREGVDRTLMEQLANWEAVINAGKKKKKGKKKKGKGKGKGKKGKKGKKLPGQKLVGDTSVQDMLAELIEQKIINDTDPGLRVEAFTGQFDFLATARATSTSAAYVDSSNPDDPHWVPANPSAQQIRQAVTEYAVLPLGSPAVRAGQADYCTSRALGAAPRSLLLYGPHGSGKTMLAQAVSN